jgi:hypothetical protein
MNSYLNEVFRQTADGGYFDYARCERADGTFYGTGGRCVLGQKVGARQDAPSSGRRGITREAGEDISALAKKAVKAGITKKDLTDIANDVRAETGKKQIKQEHLDIFVRKINERLGGDEAKAPQTTAAAKEARPVDPKVAAKVDKAMAAKAKDPFTAEQKAAQDAYLKKQKDAAREARKEDLRARIKLQEESKYNKTLEDVNRSYKGMRDFLKSPGMDTPENRAAVTAMRALRMKMAYAEIEKFRAKAKDKAEGLGSSVKYDKIPGSDKPVNVGKLGDNVNKYLSLQKAVEERQKKLDALEKLPWEEKKAKGYQKLDDEQMRDKGAMISLSRQRDFIELSKIYEAQGFNAKPELVAKRSDLENRNDLITRDNGKPLIMYRGVLSEEFADQFRGVGKDGASHFAGKGIFGNGTYAASAPPKGDDIAAQKTAKEYSGWNSTPAHITAFGIRKDANVVDFNQGSSAERTAAFGEWYAKTLNQASRKTGVPVDDLGHAAAILGIHAYRVPQDDTEDYWVILNRGALVAAANSQL